MTAPRPIVVVLLVAVIVLVGIYALGLGRGLQGPRWPTRQVVEGWLGARALSLDELEPDRSGACSRVAPGRLRLPATSVPATSPCTLTAKEARPWNRRVVVLRSAQPLVVRVTPSGKNGVEVEGKTEPTDDRKKSPRFSIPGDGATIAIACDEPCEVDFIQP
ncbi:MAG TPA: hypothetical protein VFL83_22600 [Anaeromyxobacter sp.]|nr:hypothetical protein [Anaeromyxobacter sp.]